MALWPRPSPSNIPFSLLKMSQMLAGYLKLLICLYKYSLHEKLMKNMEPHCTVRLEHLLVAFWMALTLEPIKSLCTISTMQLVILLDGLTQSPSEAVPLDLWEGPGVQYSLDGQSVALWEEVFRKSLCLLTVPWARLSSMDLVGVSNRLFRAWNQAILAVCGSQSDSSELPLVTPLAFSDLALAHLGGTLLMGGSGVEVLLIWILHWSLPDSGDDGLEASLLLGSLLASYSVVISLWEDV